MSNKEIPITFDYLKDRGTISLTTFYPSGKGVATPVEYIKVGQNLYISTRKDTYKITRIEQNDIGIIAPCTMRGTIIGPSMDIEVHIVPPEDEKVTKVIMAPMLNSFTWRMMRFFQKITFWSTPAERVILEISLPAE